MASDSEREKEESDLEVIRGRILCTFLRDDYHRDTFPILQEYLETSITSGRTKPSDQAYEIFEVISDDIRNAMDHAGRASVIDLDLVARHQANQGAIESERWISSYLRLHQTALPAKPTEIVEKIIRYEIAMARWHLNLAKMRALLLTTRNISELLDEVSAYAEMKGKRSVQKMKEKKRLDRARDDNATSVKRVLRGLDHLKRERLQPSEKEVNATEMVVADQIYTLSEYVELMNYWKNDPPVPSIRQIRREMSNRDAVRWFKRRIPLLIVTLLMLFLLDKMSGYDFLREIDALASGILIGALGNDLYQNFFRT